MTDTPRVRLLAASVPTLTALVEGGGDFERMVGSPIPAGWPEFPEAIDFTLAHLRDSPEHERPWSMQFFLDRATGRLVGSGGFATPPVDRSVEIGYEIAPEFRGRGFGTAAARALVQRAVASGDIDEVLAHTLPGPNPSTGVLAALGFRQVADLQDAQVGPVWEWRWSAPDPTEGQDASTR